MTPFPVAWKRMAEREGLIAGFGDRTHRAPDGCVLVRQVHGAGVVSFDAPHTKGELDVAADALVVTRSATIVGVRTADCVPLLLVAPPRAGARWAAAVHAGWRGALAGVAEAALGVVRAGGVDPAEVLAAIGPAIGGCCYEVGEDVAAPFRRRGLPVLDGGAKPHLDLRAVIRTLLVGEGVRPGNVSTCGPCTRCRSDRYHSFRAAPERAGRQVSWIGWRA
jgi:YfiH family protein